ncbi:MAG: GumC family protein, partial [Pseudomonadales bacterium]
MTQLSQNAIQIDKQWATTAEIDLRQYWQVINRAKLKILVFALVTSMLATLWVFIVDPVYEASATLLIESGSAKVISIEEVYDPDSRGEEYYLTHFELLNSHAIAQKVIDELQLLKHPEYKSVLRGPTWRNWLPGAVVREEPVARSTLRQRIIDTYIYHLDISPVEDTQLVEVKFEAHDAALAADVANAHARSYIANMLETKLAISQSAASWMAERLQVLKSNLQESERALQEFREREQVFDAEGLQSLTSKELNELTTRLVEARRALELARNSARQVERVQNSNPNELESV